MSKVYHGSLEVVKMLFEAGFISMPTLLQELKTFRLVDQYLLHTERSLGAITFMKSETIRL